MFKISEESLNLHSIIRQNSTKLLVYYYINKIILVLNQQLSKAKLQKNSRRFIGGILNVVLVLIRGKQIYSAFYLLTFTKICTQYTGLSLGLDQDHADFTTDLSFNYM